MNGKNGWIIIGIGMLIIMAAVFVLILENDIDLKNKAKLCENAGYENKIITQNMGYLGAIKYFCIKNNEAQEVMIINDKLVMINNN